MATLRWHGALAESNFSPSRYAAAMVIDALGGPGDFDPSAPDDAPLSARALADVKASGVTAVNVTVNEVGNAPDRFEKAVARIAGMDHEITSHPEVFVKVLRASDLKLAKSTGRMGLVFGFQDTSMLDGELKRLALFHDLGLRVCQPTYNRRNLIGDGCLEVADGGLSRLGYEFVTEVNRLGIVLDLSHAGRKTIVEGIAASTAPMAITHTGCRALVDVPRNTDDASLRALADKGGVAGIYFMPFLRATGQPRAEDLATHLDHAVNVCGEDHVGLGTDGTISGIEINDTYREYQRKTVEERRKAGISAPGETTDVFTLIPEYNEPRRFLKLADDLVRRGWKPSRVEKILGANFARLFGDVWPA
ncbi:MAG TPA: membrane dipeptidase [Steroidobacteraceae bacterium]